MISSLFVAVNSALLGRALFFTATSCFWMGLYYSFSKFAHLQFWLKNYTTATYFIDNKSIATVDSIKDLGIVITQNLKWESHYKLISGKAYKTLGLIRRIFQVVAQL